MTAGDFLSYAGGIMAEKLTNRELGNALAWVENSRKLGKLTPRELIDETLKSDAADFDVVVELMNRVLPGWQNEQGKAGK